MLFSRSRPWLALALLGCSGADPVEAASARCREADALRADLPALHEQGRLDRAARSLDRAARLCPGKADLDLEERLRLHAELGDAAEVQALADRVLLSPTASPGARAVVAESLAQVSRVPTPLPADRATAPERLAAAAATAARAAYGGDLAARRDAAFGYVAAWEATADPGGLADAARAAFGAGERQTAQRFFDRASHAAPGVPIVIDFPARDADAGRIVVALGKSGRFLATAHLGRPDARTVYLEDLSAGAPSLRVIDNEAPIAGLVISNAERLLAAMGGDGSVRLYDTATGARLRTLVRPAGGDGLVAFSPDDKLLATAGKWDEEGSVHLHGAETGELVRELEGGPVTVWQMAFSPDGKTLSALGTASYRWEVETGKKLAAPEQATDPTGGAALSPDGSLVAHTPALHDLMLFDMATGKQIGKTISIPDGDCDKHFYGLNFLPSGALRVQSGLAFRYLDTRTGAELSSGGRATAPAPASELATSPDGRLAALSGPVARLVELGTERPPVDLPGAVPAEATLSFSGNGSKLAASSPDGQVLVWDTATAGPPLRRSFEPVRWSDAAPIQSAAAAPDGSVAFSADGWVRVWSRAAGAFLQPIRLNDAALAFTPDGSSLIARGRDGWIVVADPWTSKILVQLARKAWDDLLEISADARTFARVDAAGAVWLGAVAAPAAETSLGNGCRQAPVFSPDGRLVAVVGDGSLAIWEVAGRRLLQKVTGLEGCAARAPLDQPVFDARGERVAFREDPEHVGVWEAASGRRTGKLALEQGTAGARLAFGPRNLLATSDGDCQVRLWDARTGRLVRRLAPGSGVCDIGFSRDGQVLAGTNQGALVLFPNAEEPPIVLQGADEPLRAAVPLARAGAWLTVDQKGEARIWSERHSRPLATVRFTAGAEAAFALGSERETRRVESFAADPGREARCRFGEHAVPFELCRDRVESSGLLARALEGHRTSD